MIPLPDGYDAAIPTADDIDGLVELVTAQRKALRGTGGVDREVVEADVIGPGSWTRRQLVVTREGVPVAWALVHDRAAGRTDVRIFGTAIPADIAAALIDWQQETALQIAAERELDGTQLDQLIDENDTELAALLSAAGYRRTRTWLNMTRPVDPAAELPAPREGVTIRQVGSAELADGTTLPLAEDLQIVHRMLEESFQDHFNSYREAFGEFVQRLREDPGHRWDHWWLAFIDEDTPAGAVVSSVLSADADGVEGSYVDYIGVHADARGRGVAKGLLYAVIGDAAARGRNRVGLEVDADSPTKADELYRSMGWVNDNTTQSWHKQVG